MNLDSASMCVMLIKCILSILTMDWHSCINMWAVPHQMAMLWLKRPSQCKGMAI